MSGRRGFTLVEALIAVVILAVAVPPMLVALRDASGRRTDAVRSAQAQWLAAERLEDVMADRHSTTRGYTWVVGGNYAAEASVAGFPGFTRSVAVSETGADLSSTGTGFKRVTVTVGWTDTMGRAQSVAVSTVVTDYTP